MDHGTLAGITLSAGMTDEELRSSAQHFEPVRVLMGERLTDQDDFGYSFFAVISGTVRVDIDGEKVAELGAGDHFGEVALVTGQQRNATIVALEECRLAKIMTWDFQSLMEESPALATRIKESSDARS